MKAKSPVRTLKCARCKSSDFKYEYLDGAKYRCNVCGQVRK